MKYLPAFLMTLLMLIFPFYEWSQFHPVPSYVVPKYEDLRSSTGVIKYLPLVASGGRTEVQYYAKLVDNEKNALKLKCFIHAQRGRGSRCDVDTTIKNSKSYKLETQFKTVSIKWMPVEEEQYQGVIYEISQDGKVYFSYQNAVKKYTLEHNRNQKRKFPLINVFLAIVLLTWILVNIFRERRAKK